MASDLQTTIIIPCYNEEKRLPTEKLLKFLDQTVNIGFLLVNDGSLDKTARLIDDLGRKRPEKIKTFHLRSNQGKGEAVRLGLLKAMENESRIVGYWDADLSAPLCEILRLQQILEMRRTLDAVIGARVKLIGRRIDRTIWRHYVGRTIATIISIVLLLPVYDTQCGAKLFRVSPRLKNVMEEPFLTRWLFDVEIFARSLLSFATYGNVSLTFYEEPLESWTHVGNSKIGPTDLPIIIKELCQIWYNYTLKLRRIKKSTGSQMEDGLS
ncbi:MAG: glycosyltransferase [Desulfobacteraceae bacterium]|jgi:dolichyl-phosphate beta-glucosyltransferase|nr:glycosyltransferase [Desulfobacteraceae bacterium]